MVQPSRWMRALGLLAVGILGMGVCARAQKWSAPPINVANNQDFSTSPQVAVDAAGNINVVWEDDTAVPNSNVLFSRSTDGVTFSAPKPLSHTSGFSTAPRIAVDSAGAIYVVWEDDTSGNIEIFFSKSTDGVNFSSPQNLSNPRGLTGSQPDSTNPQVAVDAFGDVDVVWESDSIVLGIFFTHSTDGGTTFSAPVNLATNLSGSFVPQMAVASDGSINVVWEDDTSTFLPTVSFAHADKSGSFSAAKTLSSASSPSAFGAQLAVDAAGNIHVVWLDSTPGTSNIFYSRSGDQGATFSAPSNLSSSAAITGGTGQNEQIATDGNGNVYVAWQDNAPPSGQQDIYLVRTSSGIFLPVQNLSNGMGNSTSPWLTVDASGSLNVAWQVNIAGQNSVVAARSTDGGATFAAVQTLSGNSDPMSDIQVAEDANGSLDAVWADDTTGVAQIFFSQFASPKPKDKPPVAVVGADQTVHATGPNGASVTLDGSASSDPDGDALTYAWTDENGSPVGTASATTQVTVPLGMHTFTLTVMDPSHLTSSASTHVTVNDQPPVARAGGDQTVNATGPSGASVTLDGSGSNDPDGDALTYCWIDENGNRVGTSARVQVTVPLGTHSFTLTVTDLAGLTSSATTHVTVSDTTPPMLQVSLSPTNLWPANHKLVQITASISATDNLDPNPSVKLVCITSNDPSMTPDDIQAVNGGPVAFGTDVRSFMLRAERNSNNPRVYTITYSVTDASGNMSAASASVVVAQASGIIAGPAGPTPTSPTLQVSVSPTNLWPANHQLVPVAASITTRDARDAHTRVELVSITSNDPAMNPNDVQGIRGGRPAFGTDVRAFLLRAERHANAPRVYTVTYCVKDASGSISVASASIVVTQKPTDTNAAPRVPERSNPNSSRNQSGPGQQVQRN